MTEQRVVLDRDRFENIFRFTIKAVREGIPEDEIWATVEVMSTEQLENSIRESEREVRERHAGRFKTVKEAIDWLQA